MQRSEHEREQQEALRILAGAGIALANDDRIEIADFGLGEYRRQGLGLVVRVNESEYSSKYLTLLPGQQCPWHYHKRKKETFFCLRGEVELFLGTDERRIVLRPGDSHTIPPGTDHSFRSREGAVIEEVSTHDENSDSYFRDARIVREPRIEEG